MTFPDDAEGTFLGTQGRQEPGRSGARELPAEIADPDVAQGARSVAAVAVRPLR